MPQALHRFYGAGDLHFVTFSCYQRHPLLGSEGRRDLLLRILERVRRRYRFVVLGYVVMPEHVHLLTSEPQRETLSTVIQALKLGFVRSLYGSRDNLIPRSRKGGETWGTCDPSRRCTFRGRSAADGWSVSEATMGAGEVVVVEPGGRAAGRVLQSWCSGERKPTRAERFG